MQQVARHPFEVRDISPPVRLVIGSSTPMRSSKRAGCEARGSSAPMRKIETGRAHPDRGGEPPRGSSTPMRSSKHQAAAGPTMRLCQRQFDAPREARKQVVPHGRGLGSQRQFDAYSKIKTPSPRSFGSQKQPDACAEVGTPKRPGAVRRQCEARNTIAVLATPNVTSCHTRGSSTPMRRSKPRWWKPQSATKAARCLSELRDVPFFGSTQRQLDANTKVETIVNTTLTKSSPTLTWGSGLNLDAPLVRRAIPKAARRLGEARDVIAINAPRQLDAYAKVVTTGPTVVRLVTPKAVRCLLGRKAETSHFLVPTKRQLDAYTKVETTGASGNTEAARRPTRRAET